MSATGPGADITELLIAHANGRAGAIDELVPLVYAELRRVARAQRRRGGEADSLSTTGLVHEAYLKLVDQSRASWRDRGHFFAVSAIAMRQILIDAARRRTRVKRGRGAEGVPISDVQDPVSTDLEGLLDLDRALGRLADVDGRLVRVVECRYFAGLSEEETAAALGVSARTAQREWYKARAWLRKELGSESCPA
jgi:RNA polymerase sigma factor (TIGR02999 family)